jgi:hypothetical protein
MKKLLIFALSIAITITFTYGIGFAGGKHYNLNIIGFAQCDMQSPKYDGDCFNGNAGDIITHGHTIFVPFRTEWIEDPCDTSDGSYYGDEVEVAELEKGVRILVSDAEEMMVLDRDATDGLARFALPDGQWAVMARPLGKPGGCMDIDTIICEDLVNGVLTQVDCDPNLANDNFVLVGHLDVDRSKNKPQWKNATSQLLPPEVGVGNGDPSYLDFFWQIFNNKLRLLQLRFYYLGPAS